MGEVYRAKDTRLGRDVAVKVLPQHLSSHPEIRARFEREAQAVSSLNHPNVCTLHDVGRAGDTDYLVMELVEGETLAQRLLKGALPLGDVLKLGGQIADALDRAHRAGVIHRDLKPGNVMLTKSGAKLMDFGLARATGLGPASELTSSPTVVGPLTAEGTIIGTFQYMAPEQLEGSDADTRADLWALGCVLYEMATGRRAFDGKSQASLITAIMGSQPAPISQLAPLSPSALEHLVQACLAKDPADRIQSAHDIKLQLQWIAASGSQSGAALPQRAHPSAGRRFRLLVAAAVIGALLLGAAAGYGGRGRSTPASAGVADVRYVPVTFEDGFVFAARFAPDGRTIVYSADWDQQRRGVYVTSLDGPDSRSLGFAGADLLAISPTGELAILNGSSIRGGNPYSRIGTFARASLNGGASRPELDGVRFADIGVDGAIAVARTDSRRQTLEYPLGHVLVEIPLVSMHLGAASFFVPRIAPSGNHVAFFDRRTTGAIEVKIFDRSGKLEVTSPPFPDWWGLAWTPGNELWFGATEASGAQTAVFSLDLRGRRRVVYRAPGALTLHDISPKGDVLASFDHVLSRMELIDVSGSAPLDRSWREGGDLSGMSASHALLFSQSGDSGGPRGSVYFWPPDQPQPVRIADGSGRALSPDGRRALVISYETPPKVSIVPTGAGQPRELELGAIESVAWAGWHPDGRIVIELVRPDQKPIVYAVSPDGGNPVVALPDGISLRGDNLISPDGSRIVGIDASGQLEVCALASSACRPLPGAHDREDVAGWSADGEFVFVYQKQVIPVKVERLHVASGARSPWKIVTPKHVAVTGLFNLIASPDGFLVYSFARYRSELYVIKGLK
jgi:Tol biopolymer transport system component